MAGDFLVGIRDVPAPKASQTPTILLTYPVYVSEFFDVETQVGIVKTPVVKPLSIDVVTKIESEVQRDLRLSRMRNWKSSDGNFSIEASLLRINDKKAVLLKKNGTEVEVELKKLSKQDNEYCEKNLGEKWNG
jgi:hypothetical protein